MKKITERGAAAFFLLCAGAAIVAIGLICVFLFAGGLPAIAEIGPARFLFGRVWKPGNRLYGTLPMILGSVYVTAGAILAGVPAGVLSAVYLARFCPKGLYQILAPMVRLLAGIPSIVYGFFGLSLLVPAVRALGRSLGFAGNGGSILTASVLLGIMILPTVITVGESAIRAVPDSYYEGGVALGDTHEKSVFFILLPAARSGILAGVVLGVGRAVGETMAVMMVVGNQARVPSGIFQGVRTLTSNIVMEMGYAADLHREALIANGVILFVLILLINVAFAALRRRAAS